MGSRLVILRPLQLLMQQSLFIALALALASLTRVSAQSAAGEIAKNRVPTYFRDVQPILMRRCARCHNDEQARFVYDWLDYKTAYEDRGEIKRRVWDSWKGSYFKESMPIDNSPESLAIADRERSTIRRW